MMKDMYDTFVLEDGEKKSCEMVFYQKEKVCVPEKVTPFAEREGKGSLLRIEMMRRRRAVF